MRIKMDKIMAPEKQTSLIPMQPITMHEAKPAMIPAMMDIAMAMGRSVRFCKITNNTTPTTAVTTRKTPPLNTLYPGKLCG